MPCVTLGSKKSYRATRVRRHDDKIRDSVPVSTSETLKPELQKLVDAAQQAVEVGSSSTNVKQKHAKRQKFVQARAKIKSQVKSSAHKCRRVFRKFQVNRHRRSAVKAAHSTQATEPTQLYHSPTTERSPCQDSPILLQDGDCIQVRPHRSSIIMTNPIQTVISSTQVASKNQRHQAKSAKRTVTSIHRAATTNHRKRSLRRLPRHRPSRADLINAESRLGSLIFGPVPRGHRREFFHDRENIWIWHESWTDAGRQPHQVTVRYEARPSGVYKKVSAGRYFKLEGAELENFRQATRVYLQVIKREIYNKAVIV